MTITSSEALDVAHGSERCGSADQGVEGPLMSVVVAPKDGAYIKHKPISAPAGPR